MKHTFDVIDANPRAPIALLQAGCLLVAARVVHAALGMWWMALDTSFRYRIIRVLRRGMLERVLKGRNGLPFSDGEVFVRFMRDVGDLAEVLGKRGLLNLTSSIAFAVPALFLLVRISWQITVACVVPTVVLSVAVVVLSKRLSYTRNAVRDGDDEVTSFLGRVAGASTAIMLWGGEKHFRTRFRSLLIDRRAAAVRDDVLGMAVGAVGGFVTVLGTVLVLALSLASVAKGALSVGDMVLFTYCLQELGIGATVASRFVGQMRQSTVSLRRVEALLPGDTGPATRSQLSAVGRRSSEFWPDGVVPGGTRSLIVLAESGGAPDVLRSGRWGRGFDWDSDAASVSHVYVGADPAFFSGTVRDNLLVSGPHPDEELVQLLGVVGLADVGLEAPVVSRGRNLSGGQRHRLAIARALATGRPWVLVEGFCDSVDSPTALLVMERFRDLEPRRILLVTTQRAELRAAVDKSVLL